MPENHRASVLLESTRSGKCFLLEYTKTPKTLVRYGTARWLSDRKSTKTLDVDSDMNQHADSPSGEAILGKDASRAQRKSSIIKHRQRDVRGNALTETQNMRGNALMIITQTRGDALTTKGKWEAMLSPMTIVNNQLNKGITVKETWHITVKI